MEYFKDNRIRVSVRNLIEFVLRSGDLDNRRTGKFEGDAMLEGGKIHRKIQKTMGLDYNAEVPLRIDYDVNKFIITVEGRADGILSEEGASIVTIDEIKGTYRDLSKIEEPVFIHKAQAMCYAYMYGILHEYKNADEIRVRITYANLDTEEIQFFEEDFVFEYIRKWFGDVITEYVKWMEFIYDNNELRNSTAAEIDFPFEYRAGQKEIVKSVYTSISRERELFIQAPTGVGKTMSVVFPAVKAIGAGKCDKIFYLTAKGVAGSVAVNAFATLREKGLHFRNITLTAKDKMCVLDKPECNPNACERAKGHFDRINNAIYDVITHEKEITREVILEYATKHNVCPFEMSLDVSNWVDGIICDYNYAFDPIAKLKRYFAEGTSGNYVLLVDEAHNLVDRAREMYSSVIVKEDFLKVKNIIKDYDKRLSKALDKCNKVMLDYKRESAGFRVFEYIDDLALAMGKAVSCYEAFLDNHKGFSSEDEVMNLYFEMKHFLQNYEMLDETYKIYGKIDDNGDFFIKLLCINPSHRLKECIDGSVNTTFFSATLLPVNYYKELFTGDEKDYAIYIDSPFAQENRLLIAGYDVSSKYKRRELSEYGKFRKYIEEIVKGQKGNYMVFFPSYKLMKEVYSCFDGSEFADNVDIVVQENAMTDKEREEFLLLFEEDRDKSLVAFCVMGGVFSEGIDLTKDRLIGTIVIGTGLPQIGFEKDLIMQYFDDKGKSGFDYAYRFPGMNKVMQAAGRVIRTKEDVGVIALLDERFSERGYRQLFPREWEDIRYTKLEDISREIKDFWRRV